ncbi:MAG: hypothetical protein ACRD7E_11450 [Bryobacteraceae bacterium]
MAQRAHELCAACHSEQVEDFKSHPHFVKNLSCDACHGASEKHRNAAGGAAPDRVAAPDEVPALCGSCHPAAQKEFAPSAHGKLVLSRSKTRAANCATCHGVHSPRTARAAEQQCSRCHASLPEACKAPVEKKEAISCMNCHHPHTLARNRQAAAWNSSAPDLTALLAGLNAMANLTPPNSRTTDSRGAAKSAGFFLSFDAAPSDR